MDTGDRLLTPGEVAALFRVDPKTVTRWAAAGRIGSIRTPGGHRRFRESEVRALLEGEGEFDEDNPPGGPAPQPGTGTGTGTAPRAAGSRPGGY
ncbi:BldC family transcriptional regulator [Catellatospora methionotrophica]|uniref:BldC family transcriptional regulator n=1 Tax=Catellatospora methionotrophica TaxID=121620 RepID=UPI003401646F